MYFENRLVFEIDGKTTPVINSFFVSEYTNIYDGEGYAHISNYAKDCNGNNKSWYEDVKLYKHGCNNSFYTSYSCQVGIDNDSINNDNNDNSSNTSNNSTEVKK